MVLYRRSFRDAAALACILLSSCGATSDPDPDISPGPLISDPPPAENAAPSFSDSIPASFPLSENLPWQVTLEATDPDGDTLQFALGTGPDADQFRIDAATGEVRIVAPPDFEMPSDANHDNIYEISVSVSDGLASDQVTLSLAVGNTVEMFEAGDVMLLVGPHANAGLGGSIANLGDLDGDQLPELAIGTPSIYRWVDRRSYFMPPHDASGGILFLSGARLAGHGSAVFDLAEADGPGAWFLGAEPGDAHVGYGLAPLGDLDDDQVPDVAVGRPVDPATGLSSLQLLSGRQLDMHLRNGGHGRWRDVAQGHVSLAAGLDIQGATLTRLPGFDGDQTGDIALCARETPDNGGTSRASLSLISGGGLSDTLLTRTPTRLTDLRNRNLAGTLTIDGRFYYCGPVQDVGDLDGDGLNELVISNPDLEQSGIRLFRGAGLRDLILSGQNIDTNQVRRDSLFQGIADPFPWIRLLFDSQQGVIVPGRVATGLGDVTGDGYADLGFGWPYSGGSVSSFILKGAGDLFARLGAEGDLRAQNALGQTIRLDFDRAAGPVIALPGREDTLLLASSNGTGRFAALHPSDLPAGGQLEVTPISARSGGLQVGTKADGEALDLVPIGDLNHDGFVDLAIADVAAGPGGRSFAGAVWLVSGARLHDAVRRGEVWAPRAGVPVP